MDIMKGKHTENFCKAAINQYAKFNMGFDEADRIPCYNSSDIATGISSKGHSFPNLTCLNIEDHLTETGQMPKPCSSKHVSWAMDNESEEESRQLISALRTERSFLEKPALLAVKFMYSDNSNTLIELVTIHLHLKFGRYPTHSEVLEYFDSEEPLTENNVLRSIFKFCESSGNNSPLKSLLASIQGSVPDISSVQKENTLDFTSSTQDNLNTTTVTTTLTNDEELVSSLKSLTIEEQKYILKLEALKKEQNYLKNSLTCLKCRSRQIDTMLLPCGHVVLCSVCSENCYICPVCNKTALAEVKTYLS